MTPDNNNIPLGLNSLIVIQDQKVAMISKNNRPVTVEIEYKKPPEMSFQYDNLLKSIRFETDAAFFTDHPNNDKVIKKVNEIFKLLGLDTPPKKRRKSKRGI